MATTDSFSRRVRRTLKCEGLHIRKPIRRKQPEEGKRLHTVGSHAERGPSAGRGKLAVSAAFASTLLALGLIAQVASPGGNAIHPRVSSRTYVENTLANGRTYGLFDWPHTTPRSLVVFLPGLNGTAESARTLNGLEPTAETNGFVVAYGEALPSGTDSHAWNAGNCCSFQTSDDVAYLRALVADVKTRTPIDANRVYIWGFSNGAMMAARAMCATDSPFAAAGLVAGPAMQAGCSRPVWWHIHGDNDLIVPAGGGIPLGVPQLGVAYAWCACWFPDSTREPAIYGMFVGVHLVEGMTHSWPGFAPSELWQHMTPFHL